MSRAFIKEDADQGSVMVKQRPPLPGGVRNLVTPSGLEALRAELRELRREQEELAEAGGAPGSPAVRRLAAIREELPALEDRLLSAVLIEPPTGTATVEVGAVVTVVGASGTSSFRIVGVDEAEPLEGLIAFTAPAAQALLGRSAGESVTFEASGAQVTLTIRSVDYPD